MLITPQKRKKNIEIIEKQLISYKRSSARLIADSSPLFFSRKVMSDSFVTPWTVAHQVPLSMGFSRQKYWSGLPCPSPGDLPDPEIEPGSLASQADSLPSEPPETTWARPFSLL